MNKGNEEITVDLNQIKNIIKEKNSLKIIDESFFSKV